MDELHGILTSYEMIKYQENPSKEEATFKTFKKTRKEKSRPKSCCSDDLDNEEVKFVRNKKR